METHTSVCRDGIGWRGCVPFSSVNIDCTFLANLACVAFWKIKWMNWIDFDSLSDKRGWWLRDHPEGEQAITDTAPLQNRGVYLLNTKQTHTHTRCSSLRIIRSSSAAQWYSSGQLISLMHWAAAVCGVCFCVCVCICMLRPAVCFRVSAPLHCLCLWPIFLSTPRTAARPPVERSGWSKVMIRIVRM